MEERRGRPRRLKPSIKRLIFSRAITQKNTPREYLAQELIKEIEEIGEIPPSFETTKRIISKARNSDNPIDEPWTLACCAEYASFFPPESIPTIVECKNLLGQMDDNETYQKFFGDSMSGISIRVAMWIVRLKPVIEHLTPKLMIDNEAPPLMYPVAIAYAYSMAEMASEMLGEDHFYSADMDNALFSGDYRTLMIIAGIMFASTAKPCKKNGNCESCDYVKVPGLKSVCVPKRKEGE
ncbi:hypothetical protein ACFLW1_00085 [Chloroflexota bacterium]